MFTFPRAFKMLALGFALSACQGGGTGPGTNWLLGDGPESGEGGKADGELDCQALAEELAALDRAIAEGNREAVRRRAQVEKKLLRLKEEGACERRPRDEPIDEPIDDLPVDEIPEAQGPGACGFDQDGDGVLSVEELLGDGPSGEACALEGGVVGCPPRRIQRPGHEVPAGEPGTGAAGRPVFPRIFPRELMDELLRLLLEWICQLGIHDRAYDAEDYDCDNFADDLEQALEELGAGVGTFTYMACDWDAEAGNYRSAHALTDVHLFGTLFWVEPQTAQLANLDANGDGQVDFVRDLSTYPTPTEGNEDPRKRCFIAVFESAAAAEAAGLILD